MNRLVTITLTVDAERFGVNPLDTEAVIELVRTKLEYQPFSWEMDADIGTEE